MNRKVLMLAYFFPPLGGGGVQRTSKFVKYLPSFGWTPVVVTVKEGAYWVSDRSLAEDVPPDVEVIRTDSPSVFGILNLFPGGGRRTRVKEGKGEKAGERPAERSGQRSGALFGVLRRLSSFFLIPDQYAGWIPFATGAAARRAKLGDISAVYTTSSPDSTHLAGLLVKRLTRKPWVTDFRDPWTERLTFSAPTRLHLKLHRYLEGLVLRNADRVVCTSEDIVTDFTCKHPQLDRRKFVVITNGFDPDDFAGVQARSQDAGAASGAKFTITHTGILTGKRNCFGFLEGLRVFLERRPDARPRIQVLFIGTRDKENEARAARLGLASVVRFEDTLPHLECIRLQSASQLLLLIEDDSYRGSLIYPAKVYEYAASGRPILALLPEGAAARLVRELNAGVVISPSDADKIAGAIELYFSPHQSGRPLTGVVDKSVLTPYERPALAKTLASLLDELARTEHRTHL
jgi:glycosyltransferase involved in cell wall biosynthesis